MDIKKTWVLQALKSFKILKDLLKNSDITVINSILAYLSVNLKTFSTGYNKLVCIIQNKIVPVL